MNIKLFIEKNTFLVASIFLFIILFPLGIAMTKHSFPITNKSTMRNSPPTDTQNNEKRLMQKVQSRASLSTPDIQAKNSLLNHLPKGVNSGIIYKNSLFSIEYIKAPDLFKVEILSNDVETSKKAAVEWFLSQGLSKQGICDLPVSFYVNFDVAKQTKQESFNPLPEGC